MWTSHYCYNYHLLYIFHYHISIIIPIKRDRVHGYLFPKLCLSLLCILRINLLQIYLRGRHQGTFLICQLFFIVLNPKNIYHIILHYNNYLTNSEYILSRLFLSLFVVHHHLNSDLFFSSSLALDNAQ